MRAPSLVAAVAVLGLVGVASGCGAKSMYDWGSYQDSLYVMWIEPGDYDLAEHVGILNEQIERTESERKRVPPGVRAHLGYLYDRAGNREEAVRLLRAEKDAFPESAVFIDGLLQRLAR